MSAGNPVGSVQGGEGDAASNGNDNGKAVKAVILIGGPQKGRRL